MGQLFCLRREQGRLDELRAPIAAVLDSNPNLVAFRCALALVHAETGAIDPAREQLDRLAADSFASVPRDATWTTSLTALSDAAAIVGDRAHAELLVDLVRPYSGRLLVATKGIACLGAADRLLGELLATCGRSAEAQRYLDAALALERRTGSELLLARTRRGYRGLRCSPQPAPGHDAGGR